MLNLLQIWNQHVQFTRITTFKHQLLTPVAKSALQPRITLLTIFAPLVEPLPDIGFEQKFLISTPYFLYFFLHTKKLLILVIYAFENLHCSFWSAKWCQIPILISFLKSACLSWQEYMFKWHKTDVFRSPKNDSQTFKRLFRNIPEGSRANRRHFRTQREILHLLGLSNISFGDWPTLTPCLALTNLPPLNPKP